MPVTSLTVNYKILFNELAINCDDKFIHDEIPWQLSQLQIYLYDFELRNTKGVWTKANLKKSDKISDDVILVGGVCGASAKWKINLQTSIQKNEIQGLRFSVGVPWEKNHLNPLTQPAPLNQSDMFWTWQMGYKFARIELSSDDKEWIFHLGSTGCSSSSPVRAPKKSCKNPNRSIIMLENYSPENTVGIDIGKLVSGLDLVKNPNCQSSPDDASCKVLLSRFGIGAATQQVFTIKP